MIGRRNSFSHRLTKRNSLRSGMSSFGFLVGCGMWLFVFLAAWTLVVQSDEAPVETDPTESQPKPSSVVIRFPSRPLPEFEFPECMGGTVSRESLKGKRWLASFVFTRCVETCPMITRNVSELHRRVVEINPEFQFVTFSVDSSFDTAEVLKVYADTFQADHDRWKFLTGDEDQIHDLIRRGFTQFVKPNLGEARKPGFEVAHSNRAVLVNEDGIPVATYLMTDPDHVVRLRRVIEGKTDFPVPGPPLSVTPVGGDESGLSFSIAPADTTDSKSDESAAESSAAAPEIASETTPITTSAAEKSTAEPIALSENSESTHARDSTASASENSAADRNQKIEQKLPTWVARLPAVNASLNSLCTVLLIAGLAAIKKKHQVLHRNLMITAFVTSVIFLACYLTYHEALHRFTGFRGRAFVGSDLATVVYRGILIPHVILAVFVPILAIRVFVHAWRERWSEHRRLAKITFPIWLFVSITGVVIYGMLYHWPS